MLQQLRRLADDFETGHGFMTDAPDTRSLFRAEKAWGEHTLPAAGNGAERPPRVSWPVTGLL